MTVVTLAGCAATPAEESVPSPLTTRPSPTARPDTPAVRLEPHVMVIVEENRGYAATLGSCPNDPYLCSLSAGYASLAAWYAIAHPSAPNYLALESGATQGVRSDCTPDGGGCGPFDAPDPGSELSGAGIPWLAYMESMPTRCDHVAGAGEYAEKHDPFMYFSLDRGSACATHILPYPGAAAMLSTLDSAEAPDFVWITPNLVHDMHDGSVAEGDAWLRATLPAVLASPWFADDGTVIITMDENDAAPSGSCCGNAPGGRVPMIVISSKSRGQGSIATAGDHYTTLRAIETAFGLALLGGASSAAGNLTSLFG